MTAHAASGGSFPDYNQLDDPGAVGAGKTWIIPAGPDVPGAVPRGAGAFIRNDADDDWLQLGGIYLGSDWDLQYLADSAGDISFTKASKISNLALIFTTVRSDTEPGGVGGAFRAFTASPYQTAAELTFQSGKLRLGESGAPSISSGGDPTAAATTQEFIISPQGVWTAGSFDFADAFVPGATLGTIAWNATHAAVQTMLNDWWGGSAFTVTGGPFPTTPMTVTFDAGDGFNIYPATRVDNITGDTDPAVAYTRTRDATSPVVAVDGSIHLDGDTPALWIRKAGVWVDTGLFA